MTAMRNICFLFVIMNLALPLSADEPATAVARVFLCDAEQLVKTRDLFQVGDPALKKAVDQLRVEADKSLGAGPFTVIDDPLTPPSGDRHDYMSIGPYWWPDLKKDDGLPYIRRDGEVNPEYHKYDPPKLSGMGNAVGTLALAYYFTGNERYAAHASELLRVWFLDEETRMNPNLNFGQAIPGRCTGRGIGIIETARLAELIDSIGLLGESDAWTEADQQGLQQWMREYLTWLRESRYGIDESRTKNNHATWYDAQAAAMALFIGEDEIAREIMQAAPERRMKTQIKPDGSQPHELARTKAFSYSAMNLRGFFQMAALAGQVDVDLWHYEADDQSGSIRRALDWLVPVATGERKFGYQQISGLHPESLIPLLRRAAIIYDEPGYETAAQTLAEKSDGMPIEVLLKYPAR